MLQVGLELMNDQDCAQGYESQQIRFSIMNEADRKSYYPEIICAGNNNGQDSCAV